MKIRVWIQTDRVGSKCEDFMEVDQEEWESMSEHEQQEAVREVVFQKMDWGFEVVK